MARVREHVYKDRHIRIIINQSGNEYLGVFEIEGMKLPPATATGPETHSEDAAFQSAKRKAEEYIDAHGAGAPAKGA
jgi:hypothetical protein